MTARWSIPGVGDLHPCIDRVVILSPYSVGRLKERLPISDLKAASHAFDITTYQGAMLHRFGSIVALTSVEHTDLWTVLAKHEHELGGYSIVAVEIAFDVHATSIDDARERLKALVAVVDKPRHQRGRLRIEHRPETANGLPSRADDLF